MEKKLKILSESKYQKELPLESFILSKPSTGFFKKIPFLFQLTGYDKKLALFEFRFSNYELGLPYFRLARITKRFGFKILDDAGEKMHKMWLNNLSTSERSINLP